MKMFSPELDDTFYKSLVVTFTYTIIVVPMSMVLSFALAVLLNSKVKGIGIFRVCCYIPVIIPASIMGILWVDFFDVRFGLANEILVSLGLPKSQFFEAAKSSMPALIFSSLWGWAAECPMACFLKNVTERIVRGGKYRRRERFYPHVQHYHPDVHADYFLQSCTEYHRFIADICECHDYDGRYGRRGSVVILLCNQDLSDSVWWRLL